MLIIRALSFSIDGAIVQVFVFSNLCCLCLWGHGEGDITVGLGVAWWLLWWMHSLCLGCLGLGVPSSWWGIWGGGSPIYKKIMPLSGFLWILALLYCVQETIEVSTAATSFSGGVSTTVLGEGSQIHGCLYCCCPSYHLPWYMWGPHPVSSTDSLLTGATV